MAHVSMLSLLAVHPSAQVCLVTDPRTYRLMKDQGHALLKVPANISVVETGFESAVDSSRALKTRLREIVSGQFVFLDTDTVVLRSIQGIAALGASFAATALGRSRDKWHKPGRYRDAMRVRCESLRWRYPDPAKPYFSSGVFCMKDDAAAHAISEAWHASWRESRPVFGGIDQPALYHALETVKCSIDIIPERFNVMPGSRAKVHGNPAILHFGSRSALRDRHLLIGHLMRDLSIRGTLDVQAIARSRRTNDVWVDSGPGIVNNILTKRFGAAARLLWRRVMRAESAVADGQLDGEAE